MVVSRKALVTTSLLVVGGALIFFGWRPLLVAQFTPPNEFNTKGTPTALDYENVDSWAAHPQKQSAALLTPDGIVNETTSSQAAVFYVHPTTYFAGDDWNWAPDQNSHAAQGIEHTIATQASVFNGCCEVYAPYYRQAHISAFGAGTEASLQALDLAYADVAQAFDHFLSEIGSDKPFFLAGHSQGSAHLQRLISDKISGHSIRERLVTGYIIGYWLPADITSRSFPDVPICSGAKMTGCIVTWDSYDRGAEELPFFSVPHWFTDGWGRLEEVKTACVNPLSWNADTDRVSSENNLGAIESQPAGGLLDIIIDRNPGHSYSDLGTALPQASSAECLESGKLLTDTQHDNEFDRSGHGDSGSYHAFDWNLFYLNIRENVSVRLHAYLSAEGILNR